MNRKRKVKVKDVVLPHSKAKVDFFKSYLEKYLSILVNSEYICEINIVDAFCGKGEYSDGGIGSPIESYYAIEKVVKSDLFLQNPTTINHIINDIKPDNTKAVIEYINNGRGIKGWKFEAYNHDFDKFKTFLCDLVDNQSNTTRTLIFLDPYGYKNVIIRASPYWRAAIFWRTFAEKNKQCDTLKSKLISGYQNGINRDKASLNTVRGSPLTRLHFIIGVKSSSGHLR